MTQAEAIKVNPDKARRLARALGFPTAQTSSSPPPPARKPAAAKLENSQEILAGRWFLSLSQGDARRERFEASLLATTCPFDRAHGQKTRGTDGLCPAPEAMHAKPRKYPPPLMVTRIESGRLVGVHSKETAIELVGELQRRLESEGVPMGAGRVSMEMTVKEAFRQMASDPRLRHLSLRDATRRKLMVRVDRAERDEFEEERRLHDEGSRLLRRAGMEGEP